MLHKDDVLPPRGDALCIWLMNGQTECLIVVCVLVEEGTWLIQR